MEPPQTPATNTPVSSRFATNAWLALGVGVALALFFWVGMWLTSKSSNTDATIACQAFGLSAISVCSTWAIYMSIRALLAGEKSTAPKILLLLASALAGLYGVILWRYIPGTNPNWPYQLMLPVILPLSAFVVWSWALWTLLTTFFRKTRNKTAVQPEQPLLDRRRATVRTGFIYAAVCVIVLAPFPMLVLCMVTSNPVSEEVMKMTPKPVLDATESVVHAIDLSGINRMMILLNNVSLERLKRRLEDPIICNAAFTALAQHYPGNLKAIAFDFEMSRLQRRPTNSNSLARIMGFSISRECTQAEHVALMKASLENGVALSYKVRWAQLPDFAFCSEEDRRLYDKYKERFGD